MDGREEPKLGDGELFPKRPDMLAGGRGTLWFIAICEGSFRAPLIADPLGDEGRGTLRPKLSLLPLPKPRFAGAAAEEPKLCGGRGTLRPAGPGDDIPPGRAAEVSGPRGTELFVPREAVAPKDRLVEAGGVIRLTVGREKLAFEGRTDAGLPTAMLARVGVALMRPSDVAPRS